MEQLDIFDHNNQCRTSQLLTTIGYPRDGVKFRNTAIESDSLYELARRNKIGSLYVYSLKQNDRLECLYTQFGERKEFHQQLNETGARLKETIPNDICYAVAKTHHPFRADFSDIDVLIYDNIKGKKIHQIRQALNSADYEILGAVPSAMTIRDKKTDQLIDIQDELGLHEVIYFDKETVRNGITSGKIGNTEMPIIAKPDDLAIHINHSITELMFTLKEYYAAVYALESFEEEDVRRLLHIVDENSCTVGCGAFFTVVRELSDTVFSVRPKHIDTILRECGYYSTEVNKLIETNYEMPHRYTNSTLLKYTADRFRSPTFAKSVLHEINASLNPKVAYYLVSKVYDRVTRDDYIRDRNNNY